MNRKRVYLLSVLSGLLLGLAYPPIPLAFLAFVGFVPLLAVIEERLDKPYLPVYVTFLVYNAVTNWWVGSWQADSDPYLYVSGVATVIGHPLFFMLPFIVYVFIRRRLGRSFSLIIFPFLWVFYEWTRCFTDFNYAWLTVGQSQISNLYWAQMADLTGVWGLSFLIVVCNVVVVKLLYFSKAGGLDLKKAIRNKTFLLYLGIIFSILILPSLYGILRVDDFKHSELLKSNKSVKAGIVQPNVNPWKKWSRSPLQHISRHFQIQDSLRNSNGKHDLFLWSETAITVLNYDLNLRNNFSFIQRRVDQSGTPLVTGFVNYEFCDDYDEIPTTAKTFREDTTRSYCSYNSLLVLHPSKDSLEPQLYYKMRLTPFSERIPYLESVPFLLDVLKWGVGISSWEVGKEQKVLDVKSGDVTAKVAPIICLESVFPGFVRNFVSGGANLLAVITNDGWFDHTSGPEQHYQIAAMRAIENRRYCLRAANTGVSGIIKPTGRTLVRAKQYEQVGFSAQVPLLEEMSFYSKHGDWLPWISLIVTALGFVYSLSRRKAAKE